MPRSYFFNHSQLGECDITYERYRMLYKEISFKSQFQYIWTTRVFTFIKLKLMMLRWWEVDTPIIGDLAEQENKVILEISALMVWRIPGATSGLIAVLSHGFSDA